MHLDAEPRLDEDVETARALLCRPLARRLACVPFAGTHRETLHSVRRKASTHRTLRSQHIKTFFPASA